MYSRTEHGERIVSTFGFDCDSCRSAILRDINSPDLGAVFIARRDDGLYAVGATTTPPAEHLRELNRVTKRAHILVHTIAVLDVRALEQHLRRQLEAFHTGQRELYALPDEVLAALCAKRHFCNVPSPYLGKSASVPGFSDYIGAVEKAVRVAAT
jgi:hypothetical protein